MKLGFVSAILPDLSLEEVLQVGSEVGLECVELMCWPVGRATRRYGGVTHIDATDFDEQDAADVKTLLGKYDMEISGLGYYPNPLSPVPEESQVAIDHLKKVIKASAMLDVNVTNTFVGRDWHKTLEANWPLFRKVWPSLIEFAEDHGVRVGIEPCPMLFTDDEWPGGKNMAHSPVIWRQMFEEVPSKHFGLNYDPSNVIWQQIDYLTPLREFADRLFHVHAKDVRVDPWRLKEVGILATPLEFHTPKLPGLGDIDWGMFFSILTDTGYDGPVCIEVEDRAYEATLEGRKAALRQSARFLRQFMS
jgi:sugar phosphate isomerase/epimerase